MSHTTYKNAWDVIAENEGQAIHMTMRSQLMFAIEDKIKSEKMTQAAAAELLRTSQPRISDLMRGKISLFALDTLVEFAVLLGLTLELNIQDPRPRASNSSLTAGAIG